MNSRTIMAGASALALVACSGAAEDTSEPDTTVTEDVAVIPESLAPFGDGYPNAGDPCLRLGESAATSNYLDDSAVLVGCPTEAAAEALGGTVVGNVDGVRLVSVPMGDANAGMGENGPVTAGSEDALVAGTDYNATTILDCGFDNKPPTGSCNAGIKRNWGKQGEHLIEVSKPDGMKRAIFFRGTEPYGADSAQADGSAGWDFSSTRKADEVTVRFGPETYVIVDAMIEGG
ncbi:hypothetical protein K3172_12665 [Qipengyuania sp. 6B39]|uniref:hypothetical protein n=1 Tax=Qipengyuania proteolytica TaxID=2867239 RepID=UPI001C89298C|nr:hypothetical protein [Qipengyuania proteolytica]MBX7496710.1 hypothetical protein [Qipengyuania proteolytica]